MLAVCRNLAPFLRRFRKKFASVGSRMHSDTSLCHDFLYSKVEVGPVTSHPHPVKLDVNKAVCT